MYISTLNLKVNCNNIFIYFIDKVIFKYFYFIEYSLLINKEYILKKIYNHFYDDIPLHHAHDHGSNVQVVIPTIISQMNTNHYFKFINYKLHLEFSFIAKPETIKEQKNFLG